VAFSKEDKRERGGKKVYLRKVITIGLLESNQQLYCSVQASVNMHYGLKELCMFIPFLRKWRTSWERQKLTQEIGVLEFPINLQKLKQLLEEAAQILGELAKKAGFLESGGVPDSTA